MMKNGRPCQTMATHDREHGDRRVGQPVDRRARRCRWRPAQVVEDAGRLVVEPFPGQRRRSGRAPPRAGRPARGQSPRSGNFWAARGHRRARGPTSAATAPTVRTKRVADGEREDRVGEEGREIGEADIVAGPGDGPIGEGRADAVERAGRRRSPSRTTAPGPGRHRRQASRYAALRQQRREPCQRHWPQRSCRRPGRQRTPHAPPAVRIASTPSSSPFM